MTKPSKMRLTRDRNAVLCFAQRKGRVWGWPSKFLDKDIRACRIAGWLVVTERSLNIPWPKTILGMGQEDRLTTEGKRKLGLVK